MKRWRWKMKRRHRAEEEEAQSCEHCFWIEQAMEPSLTISAGPPRSSDTVLLSNVRLFWAIQYHFLLETKVEPSSVGSNFLTGWKREWVEFQRLYSYAVMHDFTPASEKILASTPTCYFDMRHLSLNDSSLWFGKHSYVRLGMYDF